MKRFLFFLVACFICNAAVAACSSDEIDVNSDGTKCEATKFSVTVQDTDKFDFYIITEKGTFYIDCGGGTLSSAKAGDMDGKTVKGNSFYTCTYPSSGRYTIRFAGLAESYYTGQARDPNNCDATSVTPAISFSRYDAKTADKIVAVSGSLGALFPQKSNGPVFSCAFKDATNLKTLPDTLFSGLSGGIKMMFGHTFQNSGLTQIPNDLFKDVTNAAKRQFQRTFAGSKNLTKLPTGLFRNLNRNLNDDHLPGMMFETFKGCTSLSGYIPSGTFEGMIAKDPSGTQTGNLLWSHTFDDTKLATQCPIGTEIFKTGFEGNGGSQDNASKWATGLVACKCVTLGCCDTSYEEWNSDKKECVYTEKKQDGGETEYNNDDEEDSDEDDDSETETNDSTRSSKKSRKCSSDNEIYSTSKKECVSKDMYNEVSQTDIKKCFACESINDFVTCMIYQCYKENNNDTKCTPNLKSACLLK